MIAESWEAADPTTYVYDIRSGVTFQDGSPMTVEDVAYSIQRTRGSEERLGADRLRLLG